ncbi:MAG TPA: TilS substrate-binding domain-containing protein, partial [Nocardioidaceae bacterium]|nr:TilS substrate-binding domain-containing protein [Nocardioidaceae bacterium]
REDLETLDQLAEQALRGEVPPNALPPAVRSRVLRLLALQAGAPASELFRVHVDALVDLLAEPRGREVQLPGSVTAYVVEGSLRFRTTPVAG